MHGGDGRLHVPGLLRARPRERIAARSIRSAPAPVCTGEMRYRILTLLVLALCLVGVLSACGGKGGGY
jgi:hypothetical protein